MPEYRVFGPPGCGKTTYLSRHIFEAAKKHGSHNVLVTSFTKTAAVEISRREMSGLKIPVPKSNVGTLHSICYRALEAPEIAEKGRLLKQWNDAQEKSPDWKISPDTDVDDPYGSPQEDTGDGSIPAEYHRLRSLQCPRADWPKVIRDFAHRWEEFKRETSSVDFTDMISLAMERFERPPGGWKVGLFDEVQDFSRLELSLVRQWGQYMDTALLTGDDDQAIFSWRGAEPDAFLNPPIAPEFKRVLSQSYRLPSKIKDHAERWIKQCQGPREAKEFKPRAEGGEVELCGLNYREPELAALCKQYAESGKTVMVLATCGFMLDPLVRHLREFALPFSNPYRAKNGRWNPLRKNGKRVLSFLGEAVSGHPDPPLWTWKELHTWMEFIDAKRTGLVSGAKKGVKFLANTPATADQRLTLEDIRGCFKKDPPEALLKRDLAWFREHLLISHSKRLGYVLDVTKRHGVKALKEEAKIVPGTIHSVKGGQADVVILLPDLSQAANAEWSQGYGDSVRRVFYVGMTRAKETLLLCKPCRRGSGSGFFRSRAGNVHYVEFHG